MKIAFSYNSILVTSLISGMFSLVVALALIVSLVTRPFALPLDLPEYLALKQKFEADPTAVHVQEKLRILDVELRGDYFQRKAFVHRGAYLLMGGVAMTVLCWQWAFTMRRKLPNPKTAGATTRSDSPYNSWEQWSVGGSVLLLGVMLLIPSVVSPSLISRHVVDLEQGQNDAQDPSPLHLSPSEVETPAESPAVPLFPPQEEIAVNWPGFRGPKGAGISAYTDVPTTWDAASGKNILWRTALDLPGVSSPIVWKNHVFLTGAAPDRRDVYCIDAEGGEMLWTRQVEGEMQALSELKVDKTTGYAAPTPVTDGQRVYAIFASGDLVCYDFTGGEVWQRNFGIPDNAYGHATSLAMHEDLLIVQLDQGTESDDKSKLLAIRGATGETAWEVTRSVAASWATPIVVEYEQQSRIITCAFPWMIAYAAADGSELWRAECLPADVGPSPVYADNVVYVANENAIVAAIRDGGQGDVTDTHMLWFAEFGLPDICSPLVIDKYLLLVASYGVLACYDREQGGEEPMWEEELRSMVMSSPSLVGELVYLLGDDGKGLVLKPDSTGCQRVATNDLGEPCFSSPAFQQGRIYIRGEKHLFCIGEK